MWNVKNTALVIIVVLIVGSIAYFNSLKPKRIASPKSAEIPVAPIQDINSTTTQVQKPKPTPLPIVKKSFPRAKEIVSPSGFINTDKITIGELIGKKVILLDFWTFSCINCQRTTPYLKSWYAKYKDQGLEIIGMHTPEFPFEAVYANVKAAVEQAGIKYPVVLDNDYATWSAYSNRFWPRKYLIDIDGYIVYDHIGEGAYDETEKKVQELLAERATRLNLGSGITKSISQPAGVIDTDASKPRSPEIYFGAERNTYLGNGDSGVVGVQVLKEPVDLKTNILYLAGSWDFQSAFAENTSGGAKIFFRYQGKSLYFVAGASNEVKIKVLRDGKPLGVEAGVDVTKEGEANIVNIRAERLYKIIEDPSGYGEHTLELEIQNPGLRAYTFTFG